MKLLVISQYFYPEQFGVNDICSKLAALGHEITVLTGLPNYPMGEIFDGYRWETLTRAVRMDGGNGYYRHDLNAYTEEINGVKVVRCRLHPRKQGKKALMINYLSFAYHANIAASKLVRNLKSKGEAPFDKILVTQYSPVTMALPAISIKRKLRIPFILYCFDLWPESIVSAGLKNSGFYYNVIKILSRYIYQKADRILMSSRNFEKYLRGRLDVTGPVSYIPMYAEDVFTSSGSELEPGSASSACSLMFAGNIGKMQSIDTIIRASAELKKIYETDPSARNAFPIIFHMVGDGTALEENIVLAKELGVFLADSQLDGINRGAVADISVGVVFHGRHPVQEMPKFYNMADAMLITLRKDDIISYTLPNKVQTYMAAGKPIIAAIDGEAASVIREADCGSVCEAENHTDFARNILQFAMLRSDEQEIRADSRIAQFGRNSRNYYEQHFSSAEFIKNLLQVLE